MKNSYIKDVLQVTLALLITGGAVHAMTPPPVTPQIESKPAIVKTAEKPPEPIQASVVAPAPEKAVTWQDNPNNCTADQWIAEAAPFKCIDKPIARAPVPSAPKSSGTPIPGCGDNFYANYIYMRESGCRTTAVNSIGCRGIGQACPGSKLPCGADYACQNAWFSAYAIARYGSWEAAYHVWLRQHWW